MKVKKVNIYIDSVCKAKLQTISKKNHVSISTVVAEMCNYFGNLKPILEKLQDNYIVDLKKANKTSIKPKITWLDNTYLTEHKLNMLISNIIYCFVYEKLEEYITKEMVLNLKHKFYGTLQKRKEEYYNYNTLLRNNVRMAKDPNFMKYMEKIGNARKTKTTNG